MVSSPTGWSRDRGLHYISASSSSGASITRAGLAADRVVYIQARENRYSFGVRYEYSEEKIR